MNKMLKFMATVMVEVMIFTAAVMPVLGVQSNAIYSKASTEQVQAARSAYSEIKSKYPQAIISVDKLLEFQYTLSRKTAKEQSEYIREVLSEDPAAVYHYESSDGTEKSTLNVYSAGVVIDVGRILGPSTTSAQSAEYIGTTVYLRNFAGYAGLQMSYKVDHYIDLARPSSNMLYDAYGAAGGLYTAPYNSAKLVMPALSYGYGGGNGHYRIAVEGASDFLIYDVVLEEWIDVVTVVLRFSANDYVDYWF